MDLEENLARLGDNPISKLPKYGKILAFINGNLGDYKKVTADVTGVDALTIIYSLEDSELQNKILSKKMNKRTDGYSYFIILLSGLLGLIVLGNVISIIAVKGELTDNHTNIFITIGNGIMEIMKMLISTN